MLVIKKEIHNATPLLIDISNEYFVQELSRQDSTCSFAMQGFGVAVRHVFELHRGRLFPPCF